MSQQSTTQHSHITATCDYIGCFEKVKYTPQNNGYCLKHEKNIINDPTLTRYNGFSTVPFPDSLFRPYNTNSTTTDHSSPSSSSSPQNIAPLQQAYKNMFDTCSTPTNHTDQNIFSRMMTMLEECQQHIGPSQQSVATARLFDRMEELKNDIISNNNNNNNISRHMNGSDSFPPQNEKSSSTQKLSQKLQKRIRQKHVESRTNIKSRTNQKVLKKVKRLVRENKQGDKVTEEVEETISSSQKFETLTKFKTEHELELFVEQTTENYITKINEYAKNKELVYSSLIKWFQEIAQERAEENLTRDVAMNQLLGDHSYSQNQKEILIYWKLWQALWHDDAVVPILQHIFYYTVEPLADGNRKVFHCAFSDDKLNQNYVRVSVPEILLRALPAYANMLEAFFISKFVPFKKIYMKHQRAREIYLESKNEKEVDEALENVIDEEDHGFKSELFPEINPQVCYIKVND